MNIRFIIALPFFGLLLFSGAYSQAFPSLGLKSGLAFGKYRVLYEGLDVPLKRKGLISYNVELYGNLYERKYWGTQIALGMTTLGGKEYIQSDTADPYLLPEDNQQIFSRDYIFLKGLARALLPLGKLRLYVLAGPSALFLIGSTGYQSGDKKPEKILGAFNYGGGFEVRFSSLGILAEAQSKVDFIPFYELNTPVLGREWGRDKSFWLNLGLIVYLNQKQASDDPKP